MPTRFGRSSDLKIVDPESGLAYPRPGYRRASANGRLSIQINSLDFRGDEITLEKQPRTVRIACLGASTTFCAEVSDNHATWPHQLQLALPKRYPAVTVQVVNLVTTHRGQMQQSSL